MDEADLIARTVALPRIFADRIPSEEHEGLRAMADGGEWDELLDLLVAILRQTGAVVTPAERDKLRNVLAGWDMPTDQIGDLVVR